MRCNWERWMAHIPPSATSRSFSLSPLLLHSYCDCLVFKRGRYYSNWLSPEIGVLLHKYIHSAYLLNLSCLSSNWYTSGASPSRCLCSHITHPAMTSGSGSVQWVWPCATTEIMPTRLHCYVPQWPAQHMWYWRSLLPFMLAQSRSRNI